MLGFALPQYGEAAHDDIARFASTAEQLGADSLWVGWTTKPVQHEGAGWSVPESWVGLKPVQVPSRVHLDALNLQRKVIDNAACTAGRDTSDIHTSVRVNVAEGTGVDEVAEVVRILTDGGCPDAFVDFLYVVIGTDAELEWLQRLLVASDR